MRLLILAAVAGLLGLSGCGSLPPAQKKANHSAEVGIVAVVEMTDGPAKVVAQGAARNIRAVNQRQEIEPPTAAEVAAVVKDPQKYRDAAEVNFCDVMAEIPWWLKLLALGGAAGGLGFLILQRLPATSLPARLIRWGTEKVVPLFRELADKSQAQEAEVVEAAVHEEALVGSVEYARSQANILDERLTDKARDEIATAVRDIADDPKVTTVEGLLVKSLQSHQEGTGIRHKAEATRRRVLNGDLET